MCLGVTCTVGRMTFACHCGKTGMEQTLNKESEHRVSSEEEISPTAPARYQACDLLIQHSINWAIRILFSSNQTVQMCKLGRGEGGRPLFQATDRQLLLKSSLSSGGSDRAILWSLCLIATGSGITGAYAVTSAKTRWTFGVLLFLCLPVFQIPAVLFFSLLHFY